MSFLQLLAPFCIVQSGGVPVRTPSQSYTVKDFRVKLVSPAYYSPVTPQIAEEEVKLVTKTIRPTTSPETRLTEQQVYSSRDIKRYLKRAVDAEDSMNGDATPWYTATADVVANSLRFQPYEQIDQPLSQILVISSSESDPVSTLKNMQLSSNFPKVLKNGQFSSQIPKFIVVVHDTCESHAVDPRNVLNVLRGYFRPDQCRLVTINSLPLESPNVSQPDMWSKEMGWMERQTVDMNMPPGPEVSEEKATIPLGAYLSPEDMMGLQKLMTDVVAKGVVAEMERRMFTINQEVNASRKGLKNTFKSWWRKPKESKRRRNAEDPLYDHQSIESQIRLLGDLAFMVRDYELALSMYRMVKDDYKSDRAWHHFAAVCEMIGITIFLSGGSYKEMIFAFDGSIGFHMQAGGIDELPNKWLKIRSMTRVAMLAGEILSIYGENENLKTKCKLLERAAKFERNNKHGGKNLIPALLHEQIAFSKLKMAMLVNAQEGRSFTLRSSARHFLLAGYHYAYSFNMHHSFHSYGLFAKYYTDRELGWPNVANHVYHWLGRQLSALGSDKLAATSLIDLVNSGNLSRMPMQHQGNVLSDYFRVVAGMKEENARRYEMQLPIFFDNDLIVFQSENANVNNVYFTEPWSFLSQPEPNQIVDNASHEIWNDMYYELERLNGGWKSLQKPKLPRTKKRVVNTSRDPKPSQWCSVGELITVAVYYRNPLLHDLKLINVELKVKYQNEVENDHEAIESIPVSTIVVRPLEKAFIELKFRPHKVGVIKILGLDYTLEGLTINAEKISCTRMFDIKGKPLNNNRANASSGAREIDTRTLLDVVGPRALMSASMNVKLDPSKTPSGEISAGHFIFKNLGKVAASEINIFCNEPKFLILDSHTLHSTSDGGSLYKLESLEIPENGGEVKLPFHTCTPSVSIATVKHIYVIVEYSCCISDDEINRVKSTTKTRRIRLRLEVNVIPSVSLSAVFRPMPKAPSSFYMCLELQNAKTKNSTPSAEAAGHVTIRGIFMIASKWSQDSPVKEGSLLPSILKLEAGEALNLVHQITSSKSSKDGLHIGQIYTSKPSQISEDVHLDDIFHANSVEAARQIQADNTVGKILIIGHAGAYQNYVTQILADDDDEGDKGPKTIQEIRELANQRRATLAMDSSNEQANDNTALPVPWSEKSFSWGANPGLNLFCLWEYSNGDKRNCPKVGMTSILKVPVDPLVPQDSIYCPIRISCVYERNVQHSFDANSTCELDVTVKLCHNIIPNTVHDDLEFVFEAKNKLKSKTANDFVWLGETTKQFIGDENSLKVGEVVTATLKVLFYRKGVHDINTFSVTIRGDDGQERLFRFENDQYMVEVL